VIRVSTNPNAGIRNNSGIKCVTFKLRYKTERATIQSSYFCRRDTQQKKNDDKKHTSANQQKNKRSKRDVTATTASPGAKKDEKHE